MHTAEFQKMVRDCNFVDIQDDNDELCAVTCFLHEIGSLIHYEDHKCNLDDLYFVDPRWLCDLMSTVVTIKEQNLYVKQGILRSKHISLVFKDRQFPDEYFGQCLALLNRFEVALPLDKDHKRVLIPSMLPQKCPDSMVQQQPHYNSCYKCLILFCSMVDGLRCPTPPGLWSHLLSRIMNTVKEVKNILSDQVPVEDEVISTNIQRNNTNASATISIYSNVYEGVSKSTKPSLATSESFPTNGASYKSSKVALTSSDFECSLENSNGSKTSAYTNVFGGALEISTASETSSIISTYINVFKGLQDASTELFSVKGGDKLLYWRTGLIYSVNELTFSIESLAENTKYNDKDGILILASQGAAGRKILSQLIGIVDQLILEWYPGLSG